MLHKRHVALAVAFIGLSAHASLNTAEDRADSRKIGAVIATELSTGQQCLVDTDQYAVKPLTRASSVGTSEEAATLTRGQLPFCSAEVNSWASESSQVAFLGGPQVAQNVTIKLGAGGALLSYYLSCSYFDATTSVFTNAYSANANVENGPVRDSALIGMKIGSVIGTAFAWTLCLPVTGINYGLSYIFIKHQ